MSIFMSSGTSLNPKIRLELHWNRAKEPYPLEPTPRQKPIRFSHLDRVEYKKLWEISPWPHFLRSVKRPHLLSQMGSQAFPFPLQSSLRRLHRKVQVKRSLGSRKERMQMSTSSVRSSKLGLPSISLLPASVCLSLRWIGSCVD